MFEPMSIVSRASPRQRGGEFKLLTPLLAGLLSTAGNLVFGRTKEGSFFALDAETGTPLWDFQLGAVPGQPGVIRGRRKTVRRSLVPHYLHLPCSRQHGP